MSRGRSRLLVPLLALLVAVGCMRLGVWQLHRLQERRARNAEALASLAAPRLNLNTSSTTPAAYRRVEASGRWDYDHELVLRQQTLEGTPGVVLITPLVLEGSPRAVLVARGFVPSPDGMTLPEGGVREGNRGYVLGTALPVPSSANRGTPLVRDGMSTWARLDSGAVADRVPMPVMPAYIVEADTAPGRGFPRRLQAPVFDDGPHLSYAIQWFAFAATAIVGAGLWLHKGRGSRVVSRDVSRES